MHAKLIFACQFQNRTRRFRSPATQLGIRKINRGCVLKKTYFEELRRAVGTVGAGFNPYEVVGSGLASDVSTSARLALQKVVEEFMV